jgi:hypothetical protein
MMTPRLASIFIAPPGPFTAALHLVAQKNLRALLARALFEPAHQPGAVPAAMRCVDLARNMPFERHECSRNRRGRFRADRPLAELHAVLDQEIEGCRVLVGKDADEVAVAVSCHRGVVADPVGENLIGRILDPGLLLQGVAATEMDATAAQHAAAADVEVLVDDDDGRSEIPRRDGGRQPRNTCTDDDHIRRLVPLDLRLGAIGAGARQGGGPDAGGAFREKSAPAHRCIRVPLRCVFAAFAIGRLLVHVQSSRGAASVVPDP